MIDPTEAISIVKGQSFDWGTQAVPLARATGCILRRRVFADRDQPPFDRVAMDGIALDHATYRGGKRRFPVSHLAPAGTAPQPLRNQDYCAEVMTGAPLPPGCTTVIRYEDLERTDEGFVLPEGIQDGGNIHRRGKDTRSGTLILEPGVRVGAPEIAALATCGVAAVEVASFPRVAIASTGDEVVPVEREPLPYQIRSSNVYQLASLFRAAGMEATLAHLPDNADAGRPVLEQLLARHDLLLLSGGVSKGKLDHVPDWLAAAGVERLFHRVAQRPGKPLWVGRNARTMVFGLPGNPASSLVGAVVYVGAFLRQNLGYMPRESTARLAQSISFRPDLHLFQPARIANVEGMLEATAVPNNGSGDLFALLTTDGFLSLPRGGEVFAAGENYPFIPLKLLP